MTGDRNNGPLTLSCIPTDWSFWAEVEPLARAAVNHLGLDDLFDRITLVVDDIAADDHPWLEFTGPRQVEVYCHPKQFVNTPAVSITTLPATLPWELKNPRVAALDHGEFSQTGSARFLHHQGQALADLACGRVRPSDIPSPLVEAFQEVWGVSIDGRLRNKSFPGHPVADRRRRFFRAFSGEGMLLPLHWDVFHAAWDDTDPDHEQLCRWAESLPKVPGT